MNKRTLDIIIGPLLFVLSLLLLQDIFTPEGAKAVGLLLWMVYWWVRKPVNLTVTAGLPIAVNALFNIIPMSEILPQYASSSLVLIFGSGLLSLAIENTGLDKRIALKILSLIGPSMVSQISVWFCASALLSIFMPNVAVCALYCPIAIAMLEEAGYKDIRNTPQASFILLAIGWGAGIGGAGSPIGGAMNITAISYLENHTNEEYMYIRWLTSITPYMLIVMVILVIFMINMVRKCDSINGTREYFEDMLSKMPSISRDEIISGVVFIFCVVSAFARPLYVDILPSLEPAYVFLICGGMMFILTRKDKRPFITWEEAQDNTLWGMMLLFGGGIALGNIINGSGATAVIADFISNMHISNTYIIIIIFTLISALISELTSSTVSAAVMTPIALTVASNLGISPMILWITVCIAMNAEFILPVSVRAIPVSYGADEKVMFKKGISMALLRVIVALVYIFIFVNNAY